MAPASLARQQTEEAFLDAAERLLVDVGHAGVTTRALAEEAGANHGLVHYYFSSMENLLARVLERFTERLIARQQVLHRAEVVVHEAMVRTRLLGERPGGDPRVPDADEQALGSVQERLLVLLPGYRSRSHASAIPTR